MERSPVVDPRPGLVNVTGPGAARATDEELVARLRGGDMAAGKIIWERYAQTVRGWLLRCIGPDPEVNDLVQEVFLSLVQNLSQLRTPAALPGYLRGISVHVATSELRTRKIRRFWTRQTREGALPEVAVPGADIVGRDAVMALYRVLGRIKIRLRMVFVLRYIDGLSVEEVAQTLRLSPMTIKRSSRQALQRVLAWAAREPALGTYLEDLRAMEPAVEGTP
jgi:RNA polymerase sigma-70 factor (ECF subfamily)